MRAVVVREFGGIENAALGDMPKPEPKAGEVLLEVSATAVNFVDLVMMSGTYQFKPQLPFIPGKLPAGVVAAVGAGVTQFKPGDHAIAMAEQGGFAEFVVMPEGQCVKLPPSLPFDEAAAMALVYDTAYFALKRPRPDRAGRNRAGARRDRRRRPRRDPARQGDGRQGAGRASPARTRRTSCARPAPTRSSISPRRTCKESLRAQVFAQDRQAGRRHRHRHAGRRLFRRRGARAGLVRAAGRDRLCLGPHPVAQDELCAGEEHRSQRHADQRLPQAPAGRHAGLLRRTFSAARGGQAEAAADQGLSDRAVRGGDEATSGTAGSAAAWC